MKTLNTKKEQIKIDSLKKGKITGAILYQLVDSGKLDELIKRLSTEKVIHNTKCLHGKSYFTYSEQFVSIFENFMCTFERDFISLGTHKTIVLENLFENSNPDFLLSKKYWGNNDYIDYYRKSIFKFITYGFYKNINLMYGDLNKQFKALEIEENIDLDKDNNLVGLYNQLILLSWASKNCFNRSLLFLDYEKYCNGINKNVDDKIRNATLDFYLVQWEIMLEKYVNNRETILKMLII